jgi:hypothetical protein
VTRPIRAPLASSCAIAALVMAAPVAATSLSAAESTSRESTINAPTLRECAVLPRRNLRVRLTSPLERASLIPEVAVQIGRLWAPEGVQIQWIQGMSSSGDPWIGVDVWIAMVRELDTEPRGDVLGIVQFDRGIPRRLVRVSIDAVLLWLQRAPTKRRYVPASRLPGGEPAAPQQLATALAYVGAHELGHYLLATRHHARRGLMRAVFEHPELLDAPDLWALDARSRSLLRGRISQGESCGLLAAHLR